MNTKDIARILSSDPYTKGMVCEVLDGVHASDQLHEPTTRPSTMVVNTDESWKPGRHWVSIFIPLSGQWEYFDSFGKPPDSPFIQTFLQHKKIKFNSKVLQSDKSSVCGHYCIYYLVHRVRGFTMETIVNRFGKDKERNDRDVHDFVVDHF